MILSNQFFVQPLLRAAALKFSTCIILNMATSKKKTILLLTTVYSFFTCFILNVFGWALSYQQLTYDWKILNIREGRRVLFNYALFHFFLFAVCVVLYLRPPAKARQFAPVRPTEAQFEDSQESELKH